MKKYFKFELLTILIGLIVISCKFTYTESPETESQLSNNSAYKLAQKSLRYIQESKTDSLKNLLHTKALEMAKPDQISWLMHEGKIVLDNYKYPNDTNILKSKKSNYSVSGKQEIEMFSFPFKNKIYNDSVKYFHITVIDYKIYQLFLNDHLPNIRIIEGKNSKLYKD